MYIYIGTGRKYRSFIRKYVTMDILLTNNIDVKADLERDFTAVEKTENKENELVNVEKKGGNWLKYVVLKDIYDICLFFSFLEMK